MTERCPTCQQPVTNKPIRICFECQNPITRHHKYAFRNVEMNGKTATAYVHRHCDAPYDYVGKSTKIEDEPTKGETKCE